MSDRTSQSGRDPLVAISLAAGVGFTAYAEYQLALTIGAVPLVAVLLPLALDVYVVAAIRRGRGRDIALSLILMGTAQIAAHVLEAGVLPVSVPLVAAVSLLVPLSIWRVHALAVVPQPQRTRHSICTGPFPVLDVTMPSALRVPPPSEPAGTIGSPIDDLDILLANGTHAPVVYFVGNGSRVKIGTSQNLRRRMSQLCLRPDNLELVLHGTASLERDLHDKFAPSRIDTTEWFQRSGDVAKFINFRGQEPPPLVASSRKGAVDSPPPGLADAGDSDGPAPVDTDSATKPASTPPTPRPSPSRLGAKKRAAPKRRSLDEWVDVASPVFHDQFRQRRRNPTANEFAKAIQRAGFGAVSDSTAKNIRTEILDRTPLPDLEGTE